MKTLTIATGIILILFVPSSNYFIYHTAMKCINYQDSLIKAKDERIHYLDSTLDAHPVTKLKTK